jgi:glyoxylase-like metal-dependent hydrolase (beta-lactamase superfamily II)
MTTEAEQPSTAATADSLAALPDHSLHAFHCGTERCDLAVFDPFDPNVGTKVLSPYFFYLVRHPKGNVLVDTGLHPELRGDPAKRLGETAETFYAIIDETDDAVSKLAQVGLKPDDIDHVVMTHLHFDHAGGLEFFRHATVYVQSAELPFAYWPAVYQRGLYVRADFDSVNHWKEVTGDFDLFGDGRIVMFPTPGHTPGHQSVLVRLDGGNVILIADAHYLISKMRERLLTGVVWSPDAMVASWFKIEDLEEREDATLISTHEIDFQTTMRVAPDAFYS